MCSGKNLPAAGRTLIIDLRDEWIEKDEALGLFVGLLRIFAAQKHEKRDFNKLVVFDEAHKYMTESALTSQVVETIREMRHQATSVVIASQDPISVPRAVIELTSILVLHRMTSPQWLKHLKSAIGALDDVTDAQTAALNLERHWSGLKEAQTKTILTPTSKNRRKTAVYKTWRWDSNGGFE